MNAATTFKAALAILEDYPFRNGLSVTDVAYRAFPDEKAVVVSARVVRDGSYGLGSIRLVESDDKGRVFWLDEIHKLGAGGTPDLLALSEFIEDLRNLGRAWEAK